jgi:hypothetical protein
VIELDDDDDVVDVEVDVDDEVSVRSRVGRALIDATHLHTSHH